MTVCQRLRSTWRDVPPSCRETIGRHWRAAGHGSPRFELFPFLPCDVPGGLLLGQVLDDGRLLQLNGETLARITAWAARAVLAHEFAHVYQAARGWRGWRPGHQEGSADAIAEAWGFPCGEVHRWIRRNIMES